ncbi:MAG: DUF2809 domain-containing protein [Bacteroidetes bacterium]|nr:MAG: DUF2809 domain-containing protein [Bacteroidota bacterium]
MKAKNIGQVFNYLVLIVVAGILGILSRKYGTILPDFLARYAGDTLWAFALYFVIALFSLKRSFSYKFLWTCILSVLDELSQLYHAPWIDAIRSTTIGALILGNTFVWTDLLCYLAGAALAVVVDYTFVKTRI